MTHYFAMTNCLSISLEAVSVIVVLFTPVAEVMLAISLITNFTLSTISRIWPI
jgi:hypothetical protein